MKTVKVSELPDIALCYVICLLEMPNLKWGETVSIHHASRQIVVPELPEFDCYSPFLSWKMFGPIIEREEIGFAKYGDSVKGEWKAVIGATPRGTPYYGKSPLISALRCYVASKFGDTIEIPEELLPC